MRARIFALALLLLVLPASGEGRWGSSGSGSPAGYGSAATVFTLQFSGDGAIATGQCFTANGAALSNENTCTVYSTTGAVFVPSGIPRIKRFACTLWASAATHDPAETVTMTPAWFQGSGAGVITPVDANVTLVFNDGDDQLGDTITNTTTSANSPYTGAQGLQIRVNIVGAVTTPAITCEVVVESL